MVSKYEGQLCRIITGVAMGKPSLEVWIKVCNC